MELVTGLFVFLLGVIAGVGGMLIRNKVDSGSQQTKAELAQCQQQNAQLRQDWQDHLATFRSIATNLDEMSNHIHKQVEDAEHLLSDKSSTPAFPFFSKETTHFLQTKDSKLREKSSVSSQPLDYSGKASGVFQGESLATEEPK